MNDSEKLRRTWLAQLAVMCSPAFAKEATAALMVFLPHLDQPDGHFTEASLRAVACAPRRQSVPSYDEICRALGDWWRSTRPAQLALPPPPPPPEPERKPPSEEEVRHVEAALAEFRAHFPSRRDPRRGAEPPLKVPPELAGAPPFDRDANPIVRAAREQQARERAQTPPIHNRT